MPDLTTTDIILVAILVCSVPIMVTRYIPTNLFSPSSQLWIAIGGVSWILYAVFSETISNEVLGIPWMDARYHFWKALQIVRDMNVYGLDAVWEYFRTGNHAFQLYNAILISLGISIFGITAIHGWIAFWGGLILAKCFRSIGPFPPGNPLWLLLTVFCPSVVFWCTTNLKEPFMFWAICCVYSVAFSERGVTWRALTPIAIIGLAVGTILRPHVMLGWVAAIFVVSAAQRTQRGSALIMLLALIPVGYVFLGILSGPVTTESMMDFAEQRFDNLKGIIEQGSQIQYMAGRPIFLLSGIVSVFFRPFPWQIGSLRLALSFVEVWGMTLLVAMAWLRVPKARVLAQIKLPPVGVAMLALLWMCLLLTYYPNTGLVFRQRIQAVPALLALAIIPVLSQKALLTKAALLKWLGMGGKIPQIQDSSISRTTV